MINFFKDPIFTKGEIINNENEKKFHLEVLKQTGLDIKRTFCDIQTFPNLKELSYDGEYIQMLVNLLCKDNEKWKLHEYLPEDNPTAKIVWELFYKYLLPQYLNDNLNDKFKKLPKHRSIYLESMDLWMPRITIDKSILKVNKVIHLRFPSQKKCVYNWYNKNNNQTHFFIYKEKNGLQKDIENGNTEKMRKIAFKILKENDFFNYFIYENYQPVFIATQDLTSDELFGITRENNVKIPWVGYRGY